MIGGYCAGWLLLLRRRYPSRRGITGERTICRPCSARADCKSIPPPADAEFNIKLTKPSSAVINALLASFPWKEEKHVESEKQKNKLV
jgi:hypothetical protein